LASTLAIVFENHLERGSTRGARADVALEVAHPELIDREWSEGMRLQRWPVASRGNRGAGMVNRELRHIAYNDLHPVVLRGEASVLMRVGSAIDLES